MTDTTAVPSSGTRGTEPGTVNGSVVPGTGWEPGTTVVLGSVPPVREPGTDPYADVSAILDGTVPEPPEPRVLRRADGRCLFYLEQVNFVFGDPEGGKTWVCLAGAAEALQGTGRVLIIDLDHNGAAATVARLVALGAPTDALRNRGRFLYTEPEDRAALMTVVEDVRDWHPTVAVVDSIGELLPLFGSSSNSADEFTVVHSRVLKPLAKAGAAVLAVDHLAKGFDSRSFGPSGTGAKRRAIGGVSLRVKAKDQFTPGKGGSAVLTINKDRHGGLRQHCPTGDREPLAGTFVLHAFDGGFLEWEVKPPADGERNPDEAAPADDVAAIAALDPAPRTVDDARERLRWNKQRTSKAMREWRNSLSRNGNEEQ